MSKKLKLKYFFISMGICTFFILGFVGFTIVEKNSSYLISGEKLQFLSYSLKNNNIEFVKIHFLGKDFTFNFK